MLAPDAWVPLAEVLRPHGVRGELRLKLHNRESEVLLTQARILLREPGGAEREVPVERARRADDAILLKLRGLDDRDEAGALRGAEVCVRRADLPPLEPGEFYECDLLGARVVLREGDGWQPLGTVREMRSYPTADALVVEVADGGKPWEIPLLDTFIAELDAVEGVVRVSGLEGLERG